MVQGLVVSALVQYRDLVQAGIEIARAQFLGPLGVRAARLESISAGAAQLLVDSGGAPDIDTATVIFHEQITRDKPALRRLLREVDIKAGRIPRRRVSKAMRAVRTSVAAGLVNRSKNGQIKSFKPRARAAIRVAKLAEKRIDTDREKRRVKAALGRLEAARRRQALAGRRQRRRK